MPSDYTETTGNKRLDEARKRLKEWKDSEVEKTWRKQAISDLKYFTGEDQGWSDDGARAELKTEGRPAITLNRVQPICRLICGARPETTTKYVGREDGDVETADILSACKDHVDDDNLWKFAENSWFLHGLITNRSVVELMPNYKKDIRGEIELDLQDGMEWILDPDSKKKDRSDDRARFREVWIDKDIAKEKWPEKKRSISSIIDNAEASSGGQSRDSGKADEYQDPESNYYDAKTGKLRIVYYWYKEHKDYSYVIDLATQIAPGEYSIYPSAEKASKLGPILEQMEPNRYNVIPRSYTQIKYLIFTSDVVLEEGVTPWTREDGQRTDLGEEFPQVIFEPERLFAGPKTVIVDIIESLKDTQKFHNKLASAILHIIGTTPASGYDYEQGAATPENIDALKSEGNTPGFNMEWSKGALTGGMFQRRTPPPVPDSHVVMSRELVTEMLDISGVESLISTKALGKQASGIAIDLKQRQGGNIISWVYTSFAFFKYILTNFIRDAIQATYDYQKVIRIRGAKGGYVTINEQIYDEFGAAQEILNNVQIGEYDTEVVEKEQTASLRMERFKDFVKLVQSGALPLPPEIMIKIVTHLMDDPELRDMIEEEMGNYVAALQQQQASMAGQIPQQQVA